MKAKFGGQHDHHGHRAQVDAMDACERERAGGKSIATTAELLMNSVRTAPMSAKPSMMRPVCVESSVIRLE